MPRFSFSVNGRDVRVELDGATPLLWVLRDTLGLTGTKFGCGVAQCGACTVHVDGVATRSCVLPITRVDGRAVTTIEGLSPDRSHPLQRAWIVEDVPQCGYCQSGQIMSAAALLARAPRPDDAAIDDAMRGNVCRCGTYGRIRRAIHRAARDLAPAFDDGALEEEGTPDVPGPDSEGPAGDATPSDAGPSDATRSDASRSDASPEEPSDG